MCLHLGILHRYILPRKHTCGVTAVTQHRSRSPIGKRRLKIFPPRRTNPRKLVLVLSHQRQASTRTRLAWPIGGANGIQSRSHKTKAAIREASRSVSSRWLAWPMELPCSSQTVPGACCRLHARPGNLCRLLLGFVKSTVGGWEAPRGMAVVTGTGAGRAWRSMVFESYSTDRSSIQTVR